MSGFSLRYAQGNVLVGRGGDSASLYRLAMTAYPYLPTGGKWSLQRRLQRLAHVLGADFSVWRVNRAYPAEEYVEHTARLLDERHQDPQAWRAFLEGHQERLRQLGSHIPEVYLAVSLAGARAEGVGSGLVRNVDRVRRRVEEAAGIGSASPISAGELSELATREQRMYERLNGVIHARRARTEELQWLVRRSVCRSICEPELDRNWQPDALILNAPGGGVAFEPLAHDLRRFAQAAITEYPQHLLIESEHGRSYQALLAVGSLAEAPEFPGWTAEVLFAPLESVPWPVDAVAHCRWLGNRQALSQVRKRIADVEHAYHEQVHGAAHGPSVLAGVDRVLAREYEATLQAGGQPPMLYAFLGLAVGAPDEDELERRVAALKEQYGDITLHRPIGVQYQLWLEHLARADGWV
ncbi:MAG TPA: hypothetical protein VK756_01980 [Solirubrobacteraceae bacterium]|jgi:hypothetical protein|nr:hypothetical protein [Solirubrobacteraceae bacterium]